MSGLSARPRPDGCSTKVPARADAFSDDCRLAAIKPSLGTTETHLDLLGRSLRRYGRPLVVYTDRHSIFEQQDKGHALLGPAHDLAAILSIQEDGVVCNDYTESRWESR